MSWVNRLIEGGLTVFKSSQTFAPLRMTHVIQCSACFRERSSRCFVADPCVGPGVHWQRNDDGLALQAIATGCASRGKSGPDNSGHYNSRFWETEFFQDGGSWCTEYGHFFLSWYSSLLVQHADSVLTCIRKQLKETSSGVVLTSVEQVCLNGTTKTADVYSRMSTSTN
jgi:hypothetical protein